MLDMAARRGARIALRIVAAVAIVYVAMSAGLYVAMKQPPDVFGRVMMHMPLPMMIILPFEPLWMRARAGSINPGDQAPDFSLPTLDRTQTVQLSSFRGSRPVVLVFGSYT
jgi:hypothetical protein